MKQGEKRGQCLQDSHPPGTRAADGTTQRSLTLDFHVDLLLCMGPTLHSLLNQSSQSAERQLQDESSVYHRERNFTTTLHFYIYTSIYTASETFGFRVYCKSQANVSSCKKKKDLSKQKNLGKSSYTSCSSHFLENLHQSGLLGNLDVNAELV